MSLNNATDIPEKLASHFSLSELTQFRETANQIWELWIWDFSSDVIKVMEAIKLLTIGAIYAFHIEDGYSERVGWISSGVEVYRKIWDSTAKRILSWENSGNSDSQSTKEDALALFVKEWIKIILTWTISWDFLWIEANEDTGNEDFIKRSRLEETSINYFKRNGIEVTVLRELL